MNTEQFVANTYIHLDHKYSMPLVDYRRDNIKWLKQPKLKPKTKLRICNYVEAHGPGRTAKALKVSRALAIHLRGRKQEFLDEMNETAHRKKTVGDVYEAVLGWSRKMRAQNVKVTFYMIQRSALLFAKELQVPSFHASATWVNNFMQTNILNSIPTIEQNHTITNENVSCTKRKENDTPAKINLDHLYDGQSEFITQPQSTGTNPFLCAGMDTLIDDERTTLSTFSRDLSVDENRVAINDLAMHTFNPDFSDQLFQEVSNELHIKHIEVVTQRGRQIFDDVSQNDALLIIEGKTKKVFDLPSMPGHCFVLNKDRITAGDGVKAHDLSGKAAISNRTNAKVFEILNTSGIRTAFVRSASAISFIAHKCQMIPIEWVTRRLATGSFLKRNPGVPEGHRFLPVKLETFYKDDANHDPQWSREQIISADFTLNGTKIGPNEVDIIERTTVLVFEILEKAWSTKNCALIDMKVEFGVDENGDILLADIIDSDSWRLWPSGDKRLMVDKQVYRNLGLDVSQADLDQVRRNFEWVADQLDTLLPATANDHLVVIVMGSPADKSHCEKIRVHCQSYGLNVEIRVSSAHKGTEDTLKMLKEYEAMARKVVLIAVAGRSNGLGPVLSGNSALPVINCPPLNNDNIQRDIWSSLAVPSGLGCSTVLYAESAAIHAATMFALSDYVIWARIRAKQLKMAIGLKLADKNVSNED